MKILGITSWFHDSSACLLDDGELVSYAEEERFTRNKHTPEYPKHAIDFCLRHSGIELDDIDRVTFYFNPYKLLAFNVKHLLRYFPGSLKLMKKGTTRVPLWERTRNLFALKRILVENHGGSGKFDVVHVDHYKTHQGSAFFASPYEDAAVISCDVAVDGTAQVISHGQGTRITPKISHGLPHAFGMVYAVVTQYLGFNWHDEYKVMGMGAYGEPLYTDKIEELFHLGDDGKFKLDLSYFCYHTDGMRKTYTSKLDQLLGPSRKPGDEITQREYDMAASLQEATNRFGVKLARVAQKLTGSKNLCLAGGVGLNCVMNQSIAKSGVFDRTFFQPLASDVGGSVGGALYDYHHNLGHERRYEMTHLYLGPSYEDDVDSALKEEGVTARHSEHAARDIAQAIADGLVVGFFHGRMEAGPRALGSRSILADPRRADMKDILNQRVKHREHFRPFAPSVLAEYANDYFDVMPGLDSDSYMVVTMDVHPDKRSVVPAISHGDGTARPQLVRREQAPLYWQIIDEFRKITGVPIVINTSFNDNEPIVCTPGDAIRCFKRTRIDLLALGDRLAFRTENAKVTTEELV